MWCLSLLQHFHYYQTLKPCLLTTVRLPLPFLSEGLSCKCFRTLIRIIGRCPKPILNNGEEMHALLCADPSTKGCCHLANNKALWTFSGASADSGVFGSGLSLQATPKGDVQYWGTFPPSQLVQGYTLCVFSHTRQTERLLKKPCITLPRTATLRTCFSAFHESVQEPSTTRPCENLSDTAISLINHT